MDTTLSLVFVQVLKMYKLITWATIQYRLVWATLFLSLPNSLLVLDSTYMLHYGITGKPAIHINIVHMLLTSVQ